MRFENKTVLVTGASSGIGREIALRMAQEGADVAINYDHNKTGAMAVAAEVESLGRRALPIKADVSKAGQVEEMVELVTGAWGGLDILVNNAGVVQRGTLLEIQESMWDVVLNVNLKGVFLCSQAAARWMLPRKRGVIINVSSMRGVEGGSNSCHYAAAKAGVIALGKTLARELAPLIRVNTVAPGYVDTRIQAELTDEKRQIIMETTPMARFGTPMDIAGAVAFLASDDASFITGQTLLVDGGRVML